MQCQFDGKDPIVRQVLANGPGGSQGCILCDKSAADIAGYYSDRQEWRKINDSLWIGWEQSTPPTAESLQRERMLAGHHVKINNNVYIVPATKRFNFDSGSPLWYDTLPKKMTYLESRWQYAEVIDRYRRLWDIGATWWDQVYNAAGLSEHELLTFPQAAELAIEALSFNYRIWHDELSMLGVIDENVVTEVLHAVIDVPTYDAWVQKKSEEALAIQDGSNS
jgi:hypothetical protein